MLHYKAAQVTSMARCPNHMSVMHRDACPVCNSPKPRGSWVTPQQFAAEAAKRFACGTPIEQAIVDTFEHFGSTVKATSAGPKP